MAVTLLATEAAEEVARAATSVVTSGVAGLAWLIPALPLAGFVFILVAGQRLGRRAGWVATAVAATSFLISVGVFIQLAGLPAEERSLVRELFTWIDVGALSVRADLLLDSLSSVMLLVVTGVGSLVHLYSIGYMRGDKLEGRYFAYLNLFLFSMLVLVLGSNFLTLFVGWELVGLSSYLLIGFWFEKAAYAAAAKKAFITNRVGDVSFSIGIWLIFATFGSLDFVGETGVFAQAPALLATGTATAIALLLLGGAVGKSAQIPLFVWLPDAMAGPTPVSALIHAATMVTAGVYLIVRSSAIYVLAPFAMDIVAWVGAATALVAALIALRQDDIKKVLAYSTISQLGYMFLGVGVGAFGAGMFHLVTHAFFKGLLFLAAGSVMHALHDETDIWNMGGLRRHLPMTFATTAVAWLAISGVPPLAGFFSKDQILASAFERGHTIVWAVGLVTAALTAYYMTRWFALIFLGAPRYDATRVHPHESPAVMTIPLVLLAVGSFAGGFALNPAHGGPFDRWLAPVIAHTAEPETQGAIGEPVLIALSIVAAAVGIAMALGYARRPEREQLIPATRAMRDKFYVDEAYETVFVAGGNRLAAALLWVDTRIVDGLVNGVGKVAMVASGFVRRSGFGILRGYVAALVGGAVVVVALFLAQAR